MSEWDPDRENYEPERDYRRDYLTPRLGYGTEAERRGRRQEDRRGVWSIGGMPRGQRTGPSAGVYAPGQVVRRQGAASWGLHAGKGPRGYRRSDERIHEDVCERLERHPEVDASEVEVAVAQGEVTLSGTVPDRRMKRLAEDVAASCAGVRDVHNRLLAAEPR